jgi:hypothetical protein
MAELCALCKEKEANKTNTHYLTDAIIRTCLNLDGSKEREHGLYFDVSSDSPFINFNFQRGTSVSKLEEKLGREATEEEIEKAMQIPFSVDNVFCSDCEAKFTEIENKFTQNILPKHRENDLTDLKELDFDGQDSVTYKLFFYLQVWRTSICEQQFDIDTDVQEELRKTILNHVEINQDNLPIYPLVITYMQTTGGEAEYTRNLVGCTNDRNPNFLLMNDFIIQFFDSIDDVKQTDFYGLNEYNTFNDFVCIDNDSLKIKIIPNEMRLEILDRITKEEQAQYTIAFLEEYFKRIWFQIFQGATPHPSIVQRYKEYMTAGYFDILAYTPESIATKTRDFIQSILH